MPRLDFEKAVILILACGCVVHPASAALGLIAAIAAREASSFWKKSEGRAAAASVELKAEVARLRERLEKDSLAKAFGRNG